MSISIVACVNKDGALGYRGSLLYKIGLDMKRFKNLTTNNKYGLKNICVMGLNTYSELANPLPNRKNVVLTRQSSSMFPKEVIVEQSLSKLINHYNSGFQEKELFIIGGQRVFEEAFELGCVDNVYLTEVHDSGKDYDTVFPLECLDGQFEVAHKEEYEVDGLRFDFIDYKRKENDNDRKGVH